MNPKSKALKVKSEGSSQFSKHKEMIGGKVGMRLSAHDPEVHSAIDKKYNALNSSKGLTPGGKRKWHYGAR